MSIKYALALSACIAPSSVIFAMHQDNDVYSLEMPMDNLNPSNLDNNQLIVYNQPTNNPHSQNKKAIMLSLVNQLKASLSEQHAKINKNIIQSAILFCGGMVSYSIGCTYDMSPWIIVGTLQLCASTFVGNFQNTHQASKYHCKNDLTCDHLLQHINSLPDIENQLEYNN